MRRGVVIGKFYPFHKGHQYVIETALKKVDFLTVIVTGKHGQLIKPSVRASWIKKIYPQVKVKLIYHNIADDDDEKWAKKTVEWATYKPDFVFTSENYGDHWAQLMGAVHVAVDIPRKVFPISGTKIRENPLEYLDFLHPVVRSYFVRKICIVGAESTGSTTLSVALAKELKTGWTFEFGRYYWQGKMDSKFAKWDHREFAYIAKVQNQLEDELGGYSNKVLICDTNSLVTYAWEEFFMKKGSLKVEKLFTNRKYDLYIVTDVDIPFVSDGVRVAKNRREQMHKQFIELLKKYGQKYIVVSGSVAKRVQASKVAIDKVVSSYQIDEKIL
ncbi:MAG TPA: AAA family ATPase [Candidatus Saccharimonadales bacterium]|nr:AAA family ATPase [Candidatus Saccharimonadales bacterium]